MHMLLLGATALSLLAAAIPAAQADSIKILSSKEVDKICDRSGGYVVHDMNIRAEKRDASHVGVVAYKTCMEKYRQDPCMVIISSEVLEMLSKEFLEKKLGEVSFGACKGSQ